MAAAHEFLVVHAKNGVITVDEVRVEHHLDTIVCVVEELDASDLGQDGVVVVVCHVVRRNGRQRVALKRENSALEKNFILIGQEVVRRG